MENKQCKLRQIRSLIVMILLMASVTGYAQMKKNDDQKFQQWRSMENGKWGFSPGLYYATTHKAYSGANLLGSRMKEENSNVKRCSKPRIDQVAEAELVNVRSGEQLDKIEALSKEELIREAERLVDIDYIEYKGYFQNLQKVITENLQYAYEKSGGKLYNAILSLQDENDRICAEIEYIHKQGPDYQIEPTKRQIAYQESREKMTELASATVSLAKYAYTIDKLNFK